MSAVHLKYETSCSKIRKVEISSYSFDGQEWVKPITKLAPPPESILVLKCLCGGNNWIENGRTIDEYECNSCGQFVQILEKPQGS